MNIKKNQEKTITIDQHGRAIFTAGVNMALLVWFVYLAWSAIVLFQKAQQVNGIISFAVLAIILLLTVTVTRKLCVIEKRLEMGKVLCVELLFRSPQTYAFDAVEKISLRSNSSSLTINIEMQNGYAWTFKSSDYSMQVLHAFLQQSGMICDDEDDSRNTFISRQRTGDS